MDRKPERLERFADHWWLQLKVGYVDGTAPNSCSDTEDLPSVWRATIRGTFPKGYDEKTHTCTHFERFAYIARGETREEAMSDLYGFLMAEDYPDVYLPG